MPKSPRRSDEIAVTEKLQGIHFLDSPINIMKKHICGSFLVPVSCHDGCRENGGHSPWCGIEETTGGVNHDDIPLRIIDKGRQVGESELAFGGLQGPAGAARRIAFRSIFSVVAQQSVSLGHPRLVLDVMGFNSWLAFHNFP